MAQIRLRNTPRPPYYLSNAPLLQVKNFNKDNVPNSLMTKVKKYVINPDFSFENVSKVSNGPNKSLTLDYLNRKQLFLSEDYDT